MSGLGRPSSPPQGNISSFAQYAIKKEMKEMEEMEDMYRKYREMNLQNIAEQADEDSGEEQADEYKEIYGIDPRYASKEEIHRAAEERPMGSFSDDSMIDMSVTSDEENAGNKQFWNVNDMEVKGEYDFNKQARRYQPGWTVDNFAGAGEYAGEGEGYVDGDSKRARFMHPRGIALVPKNGGVLVVEGSGHRVRLITPSGEVTTVAGSPKSESGYRDGSASHALFRSPVSVAADRKGRIYVSDGGNGVIRMIYKGMVSTIIGEFTDEGRIRVFPDDHIDPRGICCDRENNLYFVDGQSYSIQKRLAKSGLVVLVAGNGEYGDVDGPITMNRMIGAHGLSIDRKNNVYFTAMSMSPYRGALYGHLIRKVDPSGVTSTFPASMSQPLRCPEALVPAEDAVGSVFVCDSGNNRIRRVLPHIPEDSQLLGDPKMQNQERRFEDTLHSDPRIQRNATVYPESIYHQKCRILDIAGGDLVGIVNGPGEKSRFNVPTSLCRSEDGTLYVADCSNHRIRRIRRISRVGK